MNRFLLFVGNDLDDHDVLAISFKRSFPNKEGAMGYFDVECGERDPAYIMEYNERDLVPIYARETVREEATEEEWEEFRKTLPTGVWSMGPCHYSYKWIKLSEDYRKRFM